MEEKCMNICYNESSSKDNDILDEVTNKIYNFVNEENYEEKIYETKDLDIVLAFSDLRKNIINRTFLYRIYFILLLFNKFCVKLLLNVVSIY